MDKYDHWILLARVGEIIQDHDINMWSTNGSDKYDNKDNNDNNNHDNKEMLMITMII